MIGVLIRRSYRWAYQEEGHMRMDVETGGMQLGAKEYRGSPVMLETQPPCIRVELNLRDRVLGEV